MAASRPLVLAATKSAPCSVVTCSSTTFSAGKSFSSGARVVSTNTASRSNTSTSGSVLSPWISSGMPIACMASSARPTLAMEVTPYSECVVASGRVQLDGEEDAFPEAAP